LFESCDAYLGYELMKSEDGQTYLLANKWISRKDYENFIVENKDAYDLLKKKMTDLFDAEESLGIYSTLQ